MASAIEKPLDRSSEEKTIGDKHFETAKHVHTIENLPDPDAGLSEEERLDHVRSTPLLPPHISFLTKIPGQKAPPQARLQAHPLALLPVPNLLPRPHKHWQRQSRRPARRPSHDGWPVQRQSDHILR